MSQSKQDYFTTLPVEVKRHLFSFFTPTEFMFFSPAISKEFHTICVQSKEDKLKEDYEKIQAKRLWYIELLQERGLDFKCFYAIDTFNKFKTFISLNPSYLMSCLGTNIDLIQDVSLMLSISGAEFSLQLMHKEQQKIKTLCESELPEKKIHK